MNEALASKLPQLRWRCRRGVLELDLLLNNFLDKEYISLNFQQSELFEMLLDYPDQVLFDLLMAKMRASDDGVAKLIERIRKAIL